MGKTIEHLTTYLREFHTTHVKKNKGNGLISGRMSLVIYPAATGT